MFFSKGKKWMSVFSLLIVLTLLLSACATPTSTTFVTGPAGVPMEIGPAKSVKDVGHMAVEVTDIEAALEALAAKGVKIDGEIRVSSDKTVKAAYLGEGAFGLQMRVHLFCLYDEEVDKALA